VIIVKSFATKCAIKCFFRGQRVMHGEYRRVCNQQIPKPERGSGSLFNVPMNTHIVACVGLLQATLLEFH
jgi:hypothetical protein